MKSPMSSINSLFSCYLMYMSSQLKGLPLKKEKQKNSSIIVTNVAEHKLKIFIMYNQELTLETSKHGTWFSCVKTYSPEKKKRKSRIRKNTGTSLSEYKYLRYHIPEH